MMMFRYLNPSNWFLWIRQFAFAWLMGIRWRGAAMAIPAIVVLLLLATGTTLTWSQSNDWRNGLIKQQIGGAAQREDLETEDLLLRRRLRSDPNNGDLRYRRGIIRENMDEHDEAVEIMQSLAKEQGHGRAAMWLLENAFDLEKSKDWDEDQLEEFGKVTALAVSEFPHHLGANMLHAEYLVATGKAPQAVPYLDKLAQSQPMRGLQAAAILRRSGNDQQADRHAKGTLERLQRMVADDPKNGQLRMLHAQVLIFLKRYSEAVQTLVDGANRSGDAALQPMIGEALIVWSRSLADEKQDVATLRNRLVLLQKAAEFAPSNPHVLRAIADTVLATIDEDDAQVTALRESLVAGSSPGISHFIRGTALMVQGRADEAAVHLELAAKELPHSAAILNNLAVALAARPDGDLEQALLLADQAIERAVSMPGGADHLAYFYETRGQIFLKMNRYVDAIADLEKALPVEALKGQAQRGLAAAYRGIGQEEMADSYESLAAEVPEREASSEAEDDPVEKLRRTIEAGRAIADGDKEPPSEKP